MRSVLLLVSGLALLPGVARGPQPAPRAACAADNGGITLPAGFCAVVFADSIEGARHMVVAPNGDLVVQRAANGDGIFVLHDAKGDGHGTIIERFGKSGGTGVGLWKGWLYVDELSRIVRYPLVAGAIKPSGDAQVIVDGLPTGGHSSRVFAIDGRGTLFVSVGSRTNVCEAGRGSGPSAGPDPCTELETRAGIWRFEADKTGQQFTPAGRYVTGLRNAVGLTMNPTDGKLWSTQHGRDQLQLWKQFFDDAFGSENPAEELLQINQGDDFGWPYCFYSNVEHKLVLAPEYGGDGKKTDRCAQKREPIAAFPGHWAPNDLVFYAGSQFPAKYRGGAFIAFHGSWNRSVGGQAGYDVVFQPLKNGRVSGPYEVFADGFAGERKDPGGARYRPTGLALAPDGSLYISADKGGRIWKVMYTGGR